MKKIIFAPIRTKLVFIITVSAVLLFSSVYSSQAQETDFEYIIENGGITITEWKGSENNIIIPELIDGLPVLKIGNNVFNLLEKNQNVALALQKHIHSVVMPNTVKEIGVAAFSYCNELTNVTLPRDLKVIGNAAFNNCRELTEIIIPDGVEKIGAWAFEYCALTKVTLPSSISEIGGNAFNKNVISRIDLPENLMRIGYQAFADNPLDTITMPKNLDVLENVFSNDDNFPKAFSIWYTRSGSRAGTYTFNNEAWSFEGKKIYGIITAEDGAYLSAINGDDKIDNYTIGERKYLLPPGKYNVSIRYSLNVYYSTSAENRNITVNSGKNYYITGLRNANVLTGYSIREE